MLKVFISSLIQQFTFAFISIWKIQRLYQTQELDFLGQFFIFCSLFLISQLAFDAARKTILSSNFIESTTSWQHLVSLVKRNFLLILLIETIFYAFIAIFFDFVGKGFFLGLLTIGVIVQIQSISGIFLAQYAFRSGFAKASWLQTFCTILTFPFFYFMVSSSSISLLLVLNFASNLLPGLLIGAVSRPKREQLRDATLSATKSIHKKFVLIQASENSANSFNAPLIGARLNAESVAEYSIYSRFAFLYDFIPMALFAFIIRGRDKISARHSNIIRMTLLLNLFGITLLCFLAFRPMVEFLSSGKLSPNFMTILPYLVAGAIISYTSFTIQSSVSMELLTLRIRLSASLLLFNLSITWYFLPVFGPSFAYLSTGISTLLYSFFLYLFHRNQGRHR